MCVNILSGTRYKAAIKVITPIRISARSVLGSRAAVVNVARNKRFLFDLVPSHKGIEGNDMVDDTGKDAIQLSSANVIDIVKPMHCL